MVGLVTLLCFTVFVGHCPISEKIFQLLNPSMFSGNGRTNFSKPAFLVAGLFKACVRYF